MRDPIGHLRRSAKQTIINMIVATMLAIPMIGLIVAASGVYAYIASFALFAIACVDAFLFHELHLYGPYKYGIVIDEKMADEAIEFCKINAKQKWNAFDPVIAQTADSYVFTFKSEQDAAAMKM